MNTQWSWREDGYGVACTMSHRSRNGTWLAWVEWGHLGVTLQWDEWEDRSLQPKEDGVVLISQCSDRRANFTNGTRSDSLGSAVVAVWLLYTTTLKCWASHRFNNTCPYKDRKKQDGSHCQLKFNTHAGHYDRFKEAKMHPMSRQGRVEIVSSFCKCPLTCNDQ